VALIFYVNVRGKWWHPEAVGVLVLFARGAHPAIGRYQFFTVPCAPCPLASRRCFLYYAMVELCPEAVRKLFGMEVQWHLEAFSQKQSTWEGMSAKIRKQLTMCACIDGKV